MKKTSLQKSVIWCWLQELICSCADVIPQSATDADHDNDDIAAFESINDNNDNNSNNSKLYRNNNNCADHLETNGKTFEEQQQQRKSLPNPAAVLKTVSALIALDCNPQHQNIKNIQQQHEFQKKLQKYQNNQQVSQHSEEEKKHYYLYTNNKPDLSKQRRCMLLENNDSLLEEVVEEEIEENDEQNEQDKIVHELNIEEQNKLTATCTKEQMMMMELENSNYDKFDHYDNNLNSGRGGGGDEDYYGNGQKGKFYSKNGHNSSNSSSCNIERKLQTQQNNKQHFGSSTTTTTTLSVGNLYRHCKLKTFQKIKLNLITHHGNSGGVGISASSSSTSLLSSSSSSMDATTLQTIVETDNDVISGNTTTTMSSSTTASNSGLYQIIDEKYKIKETELSLKVINNQTSNNSSTTEPVNTANNKYKLLDLSSMEKPNEKSPSTISPSPLTEATGSTAATINNTVSKRIEFFEHANIPNGGIIKPKSNIYSIYRVNDNMIIEDEKHVKNVVKLKEAGSSKQSFLLRHDSHTLTIILSCVFIVTFLLLVFFPLPG